MRQLERLEAAHFSTSAKPDPSSRTPPGTQTSVKQDLTRHRLYSLQCGRVSSELEAVSAGPMISGRVSRRVSVYRPSGATPLSRAVASAVAETASTLGALTQLVPRAPALANS